MNPPYRPCGLVGEVAMSASDMAGEGYVLRSLKPYGRLKEVWRISHTAHFYVFMKSALCCLTLSE